MYQARTIVLPISHPLQAWCEEHALQAKLLRNAALFRLRNLEFAVRKQFQNLNAHQQEVLTELNQYRPQGKPILSMKQHYMTYFWLERVFRLSCNPDYQSGLPKHAAQRVLKEAVESFKGYHQALQSYRKDPSNFMGQPKIPKYLRTSQIGFTVSNQEAYVFNGCFLKLPKTKDRLDIGKPLPGRLLNVKVIPYYDTYKIMLTCEVPDDLEKDSKLDRGRVLGLDPGVNNFLATGNNCGLCPFVVNGGIMKSRNAWYNRRAAKLRSSLDKQPRKKDLRALQRLWKQRDCFFRDQFHKISHLLVDYCKDNDIGTMVYGLNHDWKQSVHMDRENNQKFCFIAHGQFFRILRYHCEKNGIALLHTEESYTSQSSFLDGDAIPVYGQDLDGWKPSGRRIHRGLYVSKNGQCLNADVNGACNIIRKKLPAVFNGVKDYGYLYGTVEKVTVI